MKTPRWGRPSACGGLSGRPDALSITYGGFSTVRRSSRTGSRDRPTWTSAADLEVCPTTCRTLQQTFVLSAPLEFDAPILLSRGERSRIISSWQTKIQDSTPEWSGGGRGDLRLNRKCSTRFWTTGPRPPRAALGKH